MSIKKRKDLNITNVDVINKLDNTLRISKGVEEILFVLSYSVDLDPVNGDTFSYGVNLMYEVMCYCNRSLTDLRDKIEKN